MNNLKKSEKILLGVLGGAVLLFVLNMFVFSSGKKETVKRINNVKKMFGIPLDSKTKLNPQLGLSILNDIKKSYVENVLSRDIFTKWKRDSFLGAFTPEMLDSLQERGSEEFVLKAISWRDSIAYVIINDDVYREGESKNGVHVLDVVGKKVYITYNGKWKVLSFGE